MKKHFFLILIPLIGLITSCQKKILMTEQNINTDTSTNVKTVILSGRILNNITLRQQDSNFISGLVYIVNGATITIEAGVTVYCKTGSNISGLIITRGAKIIAEGTSTNPIVFTPDLPQSAKKAGKWAGLIICGTAPINSSFTANGKTINGLFQVEGGVDNAFGDGLAGSGDIAFPTVNPEDNSGVLRYVRIEYAGYAFQPDKEINALTFAAVGSATTVDHVEVAFSNDDAFEFFGGTVNASYLIAYKTLDDDFDVDNGYSGRLQFGIALRDSNLADVSKSEAIEADNNSGGTNALPKTTAVFSNFTLIGARATLANIGNKLFLAAVHLRRNTQVSIVNSVILGWPVGIFLDASSGTPVDIAYKNDNLILQNLILAGNNTNVSYKPSTSAPTGFTTDSFYNKFKLSQNKNIGLLNITDSKIPNPFGIGANFNAAPNKSLIINASQISFGDPSSLDYTQNARFSNPLLSNFTNKIGFCGAIGLNGIDSYWYLQPWIKWNY